MALLTCDWMRMVALDRGQIVDIATLLATETPAPHTGLRLDPQSSEHATGNPVHDHASHHVKDRTGQQTAQQISQHEGRPGNR
jgi:hypothetical protein